MKKSYHHGNLKEELVSAATAILGAGGPGGLSLREVAGQVGVSHASVYRHFANKEELLAAIAEQGFLALIERVDSYQRRAGHARKKQFLESGRAYVDFAVARPEQFRLMFSGVIPDRRKYPGLLKAAEASFAQLVRIVDECRTAGVIPAHRDRNVHALAAWSMLHGIAMLFIEKQFAAGRTRTRYITHSILNLLSA